MPERRTADGFELRMGTNHLGRFALTNLLLPHVTDRVVVLASNAHRGASLDFDDLNSRTDYARWEAYSRSKLANLLFALELQRRLEGVGSTVTVHAAHPGWAATNLQQHSRNKAEAAVMTFGNRVLAQRDSMGALPTLYAATQPLPGGSYTGPGGFREFRGHPAPARPSSQARDVDSALRLWALSETMTATAFPLTAAAR